MRRVKLLVVINDPESLVIYKTFFKMKKVQIATSKSWLKGLKVLHRLKPDVIMIDSQILKSNPEQKLKLIRKKEGRKIRVIVLTPYSASMYARENTTYGIIEYVNESIRLSQLLKIIKK